MPNDRAAEIREAALDLFARQGYDATSVRDIAKAVGLLPGSLYAHIRSKEQLLLEIIERGIDDFLLAVTTAVVQGEPATLGLRKSVQAHMGVLAAAAGLTDVVLHQWRSLTGEDRERVLAKRDAYEQRFVRILEQGVVEGAFRADLDTRFAVLVILGALNWASEWFSPSGDRSVDEAAALVSELLLSGLVAPRVASEVSERSSAF